MTIDLGELKNTVGPTKTKRKGWSKTVEVERSPEEIFLLSHLAPACHGFYVKNEYCLKARVIYEGCCISQS
jgi:hypothetical protein